ncbi:MAG TPA: radical SAM protein [Gemmatimonadales bacterium]
MRRTPGARFGLHYLQLLRMGTMQLTKARRAGGQAGGKLAVQLPLLPASPPARLPVLDQRRRGTDFISLPIRSVLNPPERTGMSFWSINPYVGCEFGCSYCYARDTHRWVTERSVRGSQQSDSRSVGQSVKLESGPTDRPTARPTDRLTGGPTDMSDLFEHRIYVKEEVAAVLARTLDPSKVGQTPIVIGTATDPYQPAERRFLLTRRLLETFRGFRDLTISITTKSSLVARDVDLLVELARKHDVSVNLSLATVDPVLLRQLEPRTPLPHARLRALKTLTTAGIEAGVLIAPILPGITDSWSSLAQVMEAAKEAGARFVVGMALRLGTAARARFLPLLHREFPNLAPRYEQHYGRRYNTRREYQKALERRLRLLREAYGFNRSE